MWMALLVACGDPPEDVPVAQEKTFSFEWGSSNRSEAVLVNARPGGGYYVGLEVAAPARTDQRIISIDDDGSIAWEFQLGGDADDEFDTLVSLSDGTLAVGGRRLLNPAADSDSVAIVALVDPTVPELIDGSFYQWNASNENDRISAIAEVEDGVLVFAGEAGSQLLFAEVDPKGKLLEQKRAGPELVDVEGSVALGGGTFVLYGTVTDPDDFNDEGRIWAAEINRGGNVAREVSFGELYQVRDRGTDLLVLDDRSWLMVGETGQAGATDVRIVGVAADGAARFEVTWDSAGDDLDPQLAQGPDGTIWGAVVRNRDELIPLRIDPGTGDVQRLTGLLGVNRLRDLHVDDDRFCVALSLPGDVKGGYIASFACGAFDGDEIVWPELRSVEAE